jgi:hypothetical protein
MKRPVSPKVERDVLFMCKKPILLHPDFLLILQRLYDIVIYEFYLLPAMY